MQNSKFSPYQHIVQLTPPPWKKGYNIIFNILWPLWCWKHNITKKEGFKTCMKPIFACTLLQFNVKILGFIKVKCQAICSSIWMTNEIIITNNNQQPWLWFHTHYWTTCSRLWTTLVIAQTFKLGTCIALKSQYWLLSSITTKNNLFKF
jgi:hypothetical protein